MRRVVLAFLLSTILGGGSAAIAQETPVAHVSGDDTADQIAQWIKAGDQGAADTGGNAPQDSGPPARQIHGEVGLSVSNRGYGGYAAAAVPVGQASEIDVAVGGAHDRLPWGGSANSRSLSIGVSLDARDVGQWLSHDKCGVQHMGVRLRDDPIMLSDGSCVKPNSRSGSETTDPSAPDPANHPGG